MKKYNCEYCNVEVELVVETSEHEIMANECLCEECFYDLYSYCNYCDSIELRDELMFIENNDSCICEYCTDTNENIIWCDHHNCYEYQDDEDIINLANGYTVCRDAVDWGDYFFCEDCEQYFHIDYACWCESGECYYCEDCIDNHQSQLISEYHYHDYDGEFRMTSEDEENNNKLFFGMELEIEANHRNNHDNLAEAILNSSDDFVFEEDGSLNNGFEIISMPFSRNYMKETLEDTLKDMLKTINTYDYEGKDTCGLHFHVSYEAIRSIPNLLKVVEYFKEELTTLSRREESSLNRWSPFYTEKMAKNEITDELIDEIVDDYNSRYHALNLDNDYTVEFRIFKSTTDHKTLMATWELVNNIVAFANDHEVNLNSMPSFYEIATYQENDYIENYMETMGLLATC